MMPILTAPPAICQPSGITQHPPIVYMTNKDICSTRADRLSVGIPNNPADAQAKGTTMSAWAVKMQTTELKSAPFASSKAIMPYNTDGWQALLIEFNLSHKHPTLLDQIMHSFQVWAPTIIRSFTPPNNPSILIHHGAFNEILHKEFTKQQYIGPFIQDMLETLIRPFQSSP